MRKLMFVVVASLAVVLVLVSGRGETGVVSAGEPVVFSDIIDFTLENLTIPLGTTVTWTNRDDFVPHTSTSGVSPIPDGIWDTGVLFTGNAGSFTFNQVGTFPYFCMVHPSSMQATVTVEGGGNNPPMANDDVATTTEDPPVSIDVLVNDFDADGDPLSVTDVGRPSNGTATTNGFSVTYTPNVNFVGTDVFDYEIGDGRGGFGTATISVDVIGAPPLSCTLNLDADHVVEGLVMNFNFGASVPATWNVWVIVQSNVVRLVSRSLPAIEPPINRTLTLPVFDIGTIGILTTASTPDRGIICSDFAVVNTGPA